MVWKKGESGNPKGAVRRPEIELVRQAIAEVEQEKKKSLWKHLIEQAYVDNAVLIAVGKKFIPDKIEDPALREVVRTYLVNPNK